MRRALVHCLSPPLLLHPRLRLRGRQRPCTTSTGGSETIRRSLCKSIPLSLDWRYDPRESVIPLPSGDFDRRGATRRLCHPRPTIDRQDAIARRRAGGGGRRAEVSSSLIRSDIDSSYRIRPCRWRTCRRPSNRRSRRGWIDETDVNC